MADEAPVKPTAVNTKLAKSAEKLADSAEVQEDSADQRTRLAGDRTLLASERTYAAWVRTGLAALASGVGAQALLEDLVPPWLALSTSVVLILLAEFCFVAAVWRQLVRATARPQPDMPALPAWLLILFNGFLVLVAGAVLVGIVSG